MTRRRTVADLEPETAAPGMPFSLRPRHEAELAMGARSVRFPESPPAHFLRGEFPPAWYVASMAALISHRCIARAAARRVAPRALVLAAALSLLPGRWGPALAIAASIDWIAEANSLLAYPIVVSADGQAVGYTGPSNAMYRWKVGVGSEPLGGSGAVYALSGDGTILVGQANNGAGYLFAFSSVGGSVGALPLDNPNSTHGSWATGISLNGHRACGNEFLGASTAQACWWDFDGGPFTPPDTPQGYLFGGPADLANAMSDDGTVVVGSSSIAETQGATVWGLGNPVISGRRNLADEPGGTIADVARSVCADGHLVIGSRGTAVTEEAWYWTPGGGTVTMPGLTDFAVRANDVDGPGGRVVGTGFSGTVSLFNRAVLWDGVNAAPRRLDEVLQTDHGLDLGGAMLLTATSISADGNVIVGLGFRPGHPNYEIYRVVLLAPSAAVTDPSPTAEPGWRFLRVEPNPVGLTLDLDIEASSNGSATLHIVDALGRRRHTENLAPATGGMHRRINLGGLASGVYWLALEQGDRIDSRPFRIAR